MMKIGDLAIGGLSIQKTENGRCNSFAVSRIFPIACEVAGKTGKKLTSGSKRHGFAGRVPVLEIESADQHWQLFTQMHGILDGKMIAPCLQNASECHISF